MSFGNLLRKLKSCSPWACWSRRRFRECMICRITHPWLLRCHRDTKHWSLRKELHFQILKKTRTVPRMLLLKNIHHTTEKYWGNYFTWTNTSVPQQCYQLRSILSSVQKYPWSRHECIISRRWQSVHSAKYQSFNSFYQNRSNTRTFTKSMYREIACIKLCLPTLLNSQKWKAETQVESQNKKYAGA